MRGIVAAIRPRRFGTFLPHFVWKYVVEGPDKNRRFMCFETFLSDIRISLQGKYIFQTSECSKFNISEFTYSTCFLTRLPRS